MSWWVRSATAVLRQQLFELPGPPEPPAANTGILNHVVLDTTSNNFNQYGWSFEKIGTQNVIGARVNVNRTTRVNRVRLWRVSDQSLIDSVDVPVTEAQVWTEGMFSSPIELLDGVEYLVSIRDASNGSHLYVRSDEYDLNTGILSFTGAWTAGANNTFPSLSEGARLTGLVDLVFE